MEIVDAQKVEVQQSAQPQVQQPEVRPAQVRGRRSFFRWIVKWLLIGSALLWTAAALSLVLARWIGPPTTVVHMQRRVQAWSSNKPYRERFEFVPLSQISPNLQHAVIAAEDGRFYQHNGFDWEAIQKAAEGDLEGGRVRG